MGPAVEDLYAQFGEPAIRGFVKAFYRLVPDDPVLGPMYPADDWEGAEQRLADFLVERLGGPAAYTSQRGHPRLRRRHAPFPIDGRARSHWLAAMGRAVEAELPAGEPRDLLMAFLTEVADFLRNRPDPPSAPGLPPKPGVG